MNTIFIREHKIPVSFRAVLPAVVLMILWLPSAPASARTPSAIISHHQEVVTRGTAMLQVMDAHELTSDSHSPLVDSVSHWLESDPETLTSHEAESVAAASLHAVTTLDRPLPVSCENARLRYGGALKEWQWMRKMLQELRAALQRRPFCKCDYLRAAQRLRESFARYEQWYPSSWNSQDWLASYQWDISALLSAQARGNHPELQLISTANLTMSHLSLWIGPTRYETPSLPPGYEISTSEDAPILTVEHAASVTDLCVTRANLLLSGNVSAMISYLPTRDATEAIQVNVEGLRLNLMGP